MLRTYIGIDNGTSGSIGIITEDKNTGHYEYKFLLTPIIKEQSYTKAHQIITRVDHEKLYDLLYELKGESKAYIERPLVNPKMFKTTMSAMRALESTQIILEELGIAYEFIDSKEWQGNVLPYGTKGSTELKRASVDIASRLFPNYKSLYVSHKDADGILIAEYCRRSS